MNIAFNRANNLNTLSNNDPLKENKSHCELSELF